MTLTVRFQSEVGNSYEVTIYTPQTLPILLEQLPVTIRGILRLLTLAETMDWKRKCPGLGDRNVFTNA